MRDAENWIHFLRKYGPIAQNGNMFDEEIYRAAKRKGIQPVTFDHPFAERLLCSFNRSSSEWKSVILTGTAGDGKTHLCRQVWEKLGGRDDKWTSDEPYVRTTYSHPHKGEVRIHVIRDLSAWVPQQGVKKWPEEKTKLLLKFSKLLSDINPTDFFLIAANDGQLIETWRRLKDYTKDEDVELALLIFEGLLFNEKEEEGGLKFFNLSRMKSSELFERCLEGLLSHEQWQTCFQGEAAESVAFGPHSPIRKNHDLLHEPLVQERLKKLFEFCDYNDLHIPIREILLLLVNAILGHPNCEEGLMVPKDVETIINKRLTTKASLYSNIFGGNLSRDYQESIPVFRYLNLLRIGYETTNLIDNILILGESDNRLYSYFQKLIGSDEFYGADESYRGTLQAYTEGTEEDEEKITEFLEALVAQRRALFFKIPTEWEDELNLWDLTVFKHVGTYWAQVVQPLKEHKKVGGHIVRRLVKGLNRIWMGMLVDKDQEVYLTTGLSFSNARVSHLFKEKISVVPQFGQKVEIILGENDKIPVIRITLSSEIDCSFDLTLTRFEFLNQVAEGALPNSFSKECYEDVMTFKSRVLAALAKHRQQDEKEQDVELAFCLLSVDELGIPREKIVELLNV